MNRHSFHRHLLLNLAAIIASLNAASAVHAQTGLRNQVTVSAPTRLDWKFAASGFGAKASQLPADFDSKNQRYLLYVPKNYVKDKTWPLVVFISPSDSPAGWRNWKQTCEKHGVLFCSPYAAGNRTPVGRRTRIVLDVLDDVRRKYRIDPDRTYLSGFSGGGRMACAIGYRLPEYFAGLIPFCGTNPLPTMSYLRHRAQDRLSVAFVTGEKDFNRRENEVWMHPYVEEVRVRTKLWIVPNLGHSIPGNKTIEEIYSWVERDLKRRRADRTKFPGLQVFADKTPSPVQQAEDLLNTAREEMKKPNRVWRGVTLLQGIVKRWPKSEAANTARKQIKGIVNNPKMLQLVEKQGGADERLFLLAQAKGMERYGATAKALEAWRLLARHHPNTPEGKQAVKAVRRLMP